MHNFKGLLIVFILFSLMLITGADVSRASSAVVYCVEQGVVVGALDVADKQSIKDNREERKKAKTEKKRLARDKHEARERERGLPKEVSPDRVTYEDHANR